LRQERLFFRLLDIELDAIVQQIADQTTVEISCCRLDLFAVLRCGDDTAIFNRCIFDMPRLDLADKVGIRDRIGPDCQTAAIELFKDHKQHQGDHHPDGGFGKHVVH